MSRFIINLLTAAVMTMAICQSVSADENVYQSTLNSTAWITTTSATGTGVVVDQKERLVITNYHVIAGHDKAIIFFPTLRAGRAVAEKSFYRGNKKLGIPAVVVASNKSRDIAILQLDRLPKKIKAIEFGQPCSPGQSIHSIGNPGASGALWNYSDGKVRQNYYMETKYSFGKTQMQMLETTALINEGDSGGPIVNNDGKLVGISQGFHRKHRGYSYGVDISEITWYLKQYRKSATNNIAGQSKPAGTAKVESSQNVSETDHSTSASTPGNFMDLPMFAAAFSDNR